MSTNKKSATKRPKTPKAEKAELDRIIKEIEKETTALQTPSSQKTLFFGSAFWATSAPLYLYFKGVFEVAFKENIAVFGIAAVVAAFIILPIYNAVASRNREQLIAATRTTSAFLGDNHDEEKKKKERKAAVKRSGYYALFSVNMLYLSFFLLFIAYILPTYELSHPINFTVASIFSAASVHGIGSSGLFI